MFIFLVSPEDSVFYMEEHLEAFEDLFFTESELLDFIINGTVSFGESKYVLV